MDFGSLSKRTREARGIGEAVILRRRQRENHLADFSETVHNVQKCHSRAEWEQRIHAKSDLRKVERTFSQLQGQYDDQLQSRRFRLSELYNGELEMWKAACRASQETTSSRREKMMKRAIELKQKRENDRREFVEQKRMQQFKESCDDLRMNEKMKLQDIALKERSKQLEQRQQMLDEERQYEAQMANLWELDRLNKEKREMEDKSKLIKANHDMKNILNLQVDLCQKRVQAETEAKKSQDLQMLSDWKKKQEAQLQLEAMRREQDRKRAFEVKTSNAQRAENARLEVERDREYDMRLLELALAQEAEARRAEQIAHEKSKRNQLEYQQMLQRQMQVEAEDTSMVDKLRSENEKKVWEERDAQHLAEEVARKELLDQVLASRKNQLNAKESKMQQIRQEEAAYMQQMQRDADEALQKEIREHEARRHDLRRTQHDLLQQKQERRQAIEREKQVEYLEWKRMQAAEEKHKEKIAQLAQMAPVTNYKRKTSQWYFDS